MNCDLGIEWELVKFRNGERLDFSDNCLEEIDALKEARGKALQQTRNVQEKWKTDKKVPENNGITECKMVLLSDSRHRKFYEKLHIRWMGPL